MLEIKQLLRTLLLVIVIQISLIEAQTKNKDDAEMYHFNAFKLDAIYNPSLILEKLRYKHVMDDIMLAGHMLINHLGIISQNDQTTDFFPESNMTTVELIENMNYQGESHDVTTDDGYIIQIHRILPKKKTEAKDALLPVLLQHGLFGCSSTWVVNYPNQSLGFMLSDAGFDVWLSNIRGNPYGRSHKSLDPKSKEFWDFSFEEAALHDLPSIIDYVLQSTNHTQLNYVGHSMGTTMGFVLLSTKQQYNDKVKMFFALAPAAYLHHMQSNLIRLLLHLQTSVKLIISVLKLYWFPPTDDYSPIIDKLCPPNSCLCTELIGQIVGFNPKQTNQSRISVYIHQLTKLTSTRTLIHYGQIFHSEKFRRYDWGILKNIQVYGKLKPPSYDLEHISTPTVFYCGLNDYISSVEDVKLLVQRLPHHLQTNVVDDPLWNHLDFVTSFNDGPIINNHIIEWMNMVENLV